MSFQGKLDQFKIPQIGSIFLVTNTPGVHQGQGLVRDSRAAILKPQMTGPEGDRQWWFQVGMVQGHFKSYSFYSSASLSPQFTESLWIQGMGGGRIERNWVTYSSRSFLKYLTFWSLFLFEVTYLRWWKLQPVLLVAPVDEILGVRGMRKEPTINSNKVFPDHHGLDAQYCQMLFCCCC